jgi:hypothetical protein
MPSSNLSAIILGPMARARSRRAPPARGSEPVSMPMPAPSPAMDRAERAEPEVPPIESAEPEFVRALLIDPATETVAEVKLPCEPGDAARGYGSQLAQSALVAVIGSDALQWADITDDLTAVMDASDAYDEAEGTSWRYGADGEQMTGRAIIAGYDAANDAFVDAKPTLDEATAAITWGADAGEADEAEPPYQRSTGMRASRPRETEVRRT